jgi:plasmid stabilization system protein ParE
LLDRCATLADNLCAFLIVPRYERHNIRRCVHRDGLIFYRVHKDGVEVIHILHRAMDYDALLFSDN